MAHYPTGSVDSLSSDRLGNAAQVVVFQPETALVSQHGLHSQPPRTSSLHSPIMQLTGHQAEVNTCKFSPNGQTLASGSFDRLIFLWTVYGECENYNVLRGHSGAITDIHYCPDGSKLISCSVDKTLCLWDLEAGERLKKFKGHSSFVNCCSSTRRGPQLFASGSDDGTVRVWDPRQKSCVKLFNSTYQVTTVVFGEGGDQLFSGGIDNQVHLWDLRRGDLLFKLSGHSDTITGMCLSPEGSRLLTNSMDNTLRVWDVRPFVSGGRELKQLLGVQHTFEKKLLRCTWTPDGSKVAAGSGDQCVYIWNVDSGHTLYKLPGHTGSVNDVHFHPHEPILLSGSSDKNLYLGELML